MPITNPLTKARQRRKARRLKQAEELAAKHEVARQAFLRHLQTPAVLGRVYAGTANPNKVAKRRAKNKRAKQSRKVNR